MTLEEKKAKLLEIQKDFKKRYGEDSAPKKATEFNKVDFYSTGVLGIDLALGGGIGKGRMSTISGTESSCKTTLALTTIANAMKEDESLMAYYYDAENALDREYAKNLGVDLERLIVDDTVVAEEGLTKLRDAIASGIFGIAVLDSTNALSPSKENEEDVSSTSMALRARILSNAYPQLINVCGKTKTTLIVIEQIRKAIGVMYGNPEINTVGEAGKFYASQRITMRRQTKVTEEDGVAVSNEVKFKTIKNKLASPFRTCDLVCIYGKGFDDVTDTANLAIKFDVVQDKGHSYMKGTKDEKKWKSKDEFVAYLSKDKELFEKIKKETLEAYKNSDPSTVMQDTDLTDKLNEEKDKLKKIKETTTESEVDDNEE